MTGLLAILAIMAQQPAPPQWPVHSLERPKPPVVMPARAGAPAVAPSDAIVLFDGHDLREWQQGDGQPARWRVVDGAVEVVPRTGSMMTRRTFGDVQLHLEWSAPAPPRGSGQERGNSGVFLMGCYEIQVLDSYRNETYADGQAAAVYGQHPPLVNATRPPGEWNVYDIIFRRPRFNAAGALEAPGRFTVFHNGVLVLDNVAILGRTTHGRAAEYAPHDDRGPLSLQDHGDPVRFRNIWIRDLESP